MKIYMKDYLSFEDMIEQFKFEAVQEDGTNYIYIENPSEKLQLSLLSRSKNWFDKIQNRSQKSTEI